MPVALWYAYIVGRPGQFFWSGGKVAVSDVVVGGAPDCAVFFVMGEGDFIWEQRFMRQGVR